MACCRAVNLTWDIHMMFEDWPDLYRADASSLSAAAQEGAKFISSTGTPHPQAEAAAQEGADMGRALFRGVQTAQPRPQQVCAGGWHRCRHQPSSVLSHPLTEAAIVS